VQLIVSEWPVTGTEHRARGTGFEALRTLITDFRRLRAEQRIEPAEWVVAAIIADKAMKSLVESNFYVVKALARTSSFAFVDTFADGWATAVSGTATIGINVAIVVDVAKEKAKIQKEIAEVEKYVSGLEAQLSNAEFISKAPARVVEGMKAKKNEGEAKLEALKGRIT
jgi:valyl-tRNA synthetase